MKLQPHQVHRTHQYSFDDVFRVSCEELFVGLIEGDDETDADRNGAKEAHKCSLPYRGLEVLSVDLVQELEQHGYDYHRLQYPIGRRKTNGRCYGMIARSSLNTHTVE